jgi:hypothetical protein
MAMEKIKSANKKWRRVARRKQQILAGALKRRKADSRKRRKHAILE